MAFVGDRLDRFADQAPNQPALICGNRVVSRLDLAKQVRAVAAGVSVRAGTKAPVALELENGADFLIAFLGIIRSGCRALVFDPAWPLGLRQKILDQAAPSLVVDRVVLKDILVIGDHGTFNPPDKHDPFYVGFTSGTTGIPKGFRRSHASWLESFRVAEESLGLSQDDTILLPGSLQHSLHLFGAVHALHLGARTIQLREFQPEATLRQIRQHEAGVFYCTPTQLHYLVERAQTRNWTLPSVRLILTSGAKWQGRDFEALRRIFPNARLCEFYGASETSFISIALHGDQTPLTSVGRPAPGVAIAVRGKDGTDLPPNNSGRLWVKSAMLFDGYECGGSGDTRWDKGWLTVGDRGCIDENGFLYVSGRENRMIITSGVNIYPEEVERVISLHADISQAAVFDLDDPVRGQCVVAAYESSGPEPDQGTLRNWCRRHLPKEKVPRIFVPVREWPLTPGGKTDLIKLRNRVCLQRGSNRPEDTD